MRFRVILARDPFRSAYSAAAPHRAGPRYLREASRRRDRCGSLLVPFIFRAPRNEGIRWNGGRARVPNFPARLQKYAGHANRQPASLWDRDLFGGKFRSRYHYQNCDLPICGCGARCDYADRPLLLSGAHRSVMVCRDFCSCLSCGHGACASDRALERAGPGAEHR